MAITNFIPTVWSENLYQELDRKYIGVANCNRDFEGEIREKGNTVRICGIGNVVVSEYTKNANMNAPSTLSDNARDLKIDQAKYFNFQIDDVDRVQSTPKLMDEAMRTAATALANEADAYIFSLYTDANFALEETNPTAEKIVDEIIDLKTKIMRNNVMNSDDMVIEVSPEVAAMILKAKIDLGTNNYDALETGLLGKIAGCKVYVSNNVYVDEENNHKCLVRTKRAIAFAEQISEVEAYRPEKRFADAVKGLHLYGAKVVYPEEFMVLSVKIQA